MEEREEKTKANLPFKISISLIKGKWMSSRDTIADVLLENVASPLLLSSLPSYDSVPPFQISAGIPNKADRICTCTLEKLC